MYFLAGAVAFASAQAVLFLVFDQSARPSVDASGWFLNSGTGIAAMATVLAITAFTVKTAMWRSWALFVAGGVLALVAAVFLFGPGTIFPIVIAAGAGLIALAALAGALAARVVSRSASKS
jgi:hypothetical protein